MLFVVVDLLVIAQLPEGKFPRLRALLMSNPGVCNDLGSGYVAPSRDGCAVRKDPRPIVDGGEAGIRHGGGECVTRASGFDLKFETRHYMEIGASGRMTFASGHGE